MKNKKPTALTREALLRQQILARETLEQLAQLYPAAFDEHGRPIVAELRLPLLKDKNAPND